MSCYSQHALLYHHLFLYLTCSCLFPYNLMITKAYKCRTNGGKSMPQAPVEKPGLPVTTRDNNLMFIWSVSVLLIQILALLQRERERAVDFLKMQRLLHPLMCLLDDSNEVLLIMSWCKLLWKRHIWHLTVKDVHVPHPLKS